MHPGTPKFFLVMLILTTLSACSAAGGADEASSGAGGTVGLAVSETCTEGSDPQCVAVNGESVLSPSAYEPAGVEDAAVAEGGGQNAIDLTFDDEGARVFHALTAQAAEAGGTARLVMEFGDEIVAAVAVPAAMESDQVQMMLSPDDSAQNLVDLIHEG